MGSLFKEFFRFRLYKNSQGRLVRRLTMLGVFAVFASGAYKFFHLAFGSIPFLQAIEVRGAIAGLICLFGAWIAFRLVNWPTFADFLVSVEAEMVKVSWPGKAELYSSTIVVLVMFFILSAMILVFDTAWIWFFRFLNVM